MGRRAQSRTGTCEGPFTRRGGVVVFKLRWYDAEGVRQCETFATADERVAQRRLARLVTEVHEQLAGMRSKPAATLPTLSAFTVKTALEFLPTRQAEAQIDRTLAILARVWEPELGATPLDRIRTADVRRVLAALTTAKKSAATVNRALAALSVVFQAAVEWELLEVNPCQRRGLHRREGFKAPRYLTRPEVAAMLAHADDRWRALFATAVYTGLRAGELFRLRWRDVDLERRVLVVRKAKSGHQRVVPLHPELLAFLAQPGPPEHLVFVGDPRRGKTEVDPERDQVVAPRKALLRACKAAGIHRHVTMRDLRDTFGTLVADANVSLPQLRDWMGHSSLAVTNRYAHATGAEQLERLTITGPKTAVPLPLGPSGSTESGDTPVPRTPAKRRFHVRPRA